MPPAVPSDPSALAPGTTFAAYRIESQLGAGGMGVVYRATQVALARVVALKVMRPELGRKADFRERFLREARAAAAIHHPNVVTIHDAGDHDGTLYMAFEFVSGGDLAGLLRRRSPLPLHEAVRLVADCAEGLAALHRAGLVHRDIKPHNIFLDENARAKLGDLGLARREGGEDRMTMTGQGLGTPAYMAPEQAAGISDIDIRADLYALGGTLFTLLTGRPPFDGPTPWAVVDQVLHHPPPDPAMLNPAIGPELRTVVQRLMAKSRDDRFADPQALLTALRALPAGTRAELPAHATLSGGDTIAPTAATAATALTAAPRRRGRLLALALIAIAAAAAATWFAARPRLDPALGARLLASIEALPADADEGTVGALRDQVERQLAGLPESGRPAVRKALDHRMLALTARRLEREATLTRRLIPLERAWKAIEDELHQTEERGRELRAAVDSAGDAARAAYRRERSVRWDAWLGWLRTHVRDHPAPLRLATAQRFLQARTSGEAESELVAAEAALKDDAATRQGERRTRYDLPFWQHCVDAFRAGNRTLVDWYRVDEPDGHGFTATRAALAGLDRAEPPPPPARELLGVLAALAGDGDAAVKSGLAKLARIAALERDLARLDRPGAIGAADQRRLAGAQVELAGLVGADGEAVRRWQQALAGTGERFARVQRDLATLAGKTLAGEDLTRHAALVDELAGLVPADDPELKRLRRAHTAALAEDAWRRAGECRDRYLHADLVVAAAAAGHLAAGGRLVTLAMWDEMRVLDPRQVDLVAWKQAKEPVHGMTGAQIYGELLANWAVRHGEDLGDTLVPTMVEARELILSGPLEHPILLSEAAWLLDSYLPKDAERAKKLRTQALAGVHRHLDGHDWLADASLIKVAVDCASQLKDEARQAELCAQGLVLAEKADAREDMAWFVQPSHNPRGLWKRAGDLYAEAAKARELAKHPASAALCLHSQGWCLQPDNNPAGSWERAIACYERAASLRGQAGDAAGRAASLFQQGWCLRPDLNPGSGDWTRALACFAESARLYGESGNPSEQAGSTVRRAWATQPDNNPGGSWKQAYALYGEAARLYQIAGATAKRSVAIHQQGWCVQPDHDPEGTWATAAERYREAANLAESDSAASSWNQAAYSHRKLAEAAAKAGRPAEQAEQFASQAECLNPERNSEGNWADAAALYAKAAELCRAGDRKRCGELLHQQARSIFHDEDAKDRWTIAIRLGTEAARLRGAAGDQDGEATSLHQVAWCLQPDNNPAGSWEQARALYQRAANLHGEAGSRGDQGVSRFQEAVCMIEGDGKKLTAPVRAMITAAAKQVREAGDEARARQMLAWLE